MREFIFSSTSATEASNINANDLPHSGSTNRSPVIQWTETYKHMKKQQEVEGGTEGD